MLTWHKPLPRIGCICGFSNTFCKTRLATVVAASVLGLWNERGSTRCLCAAVNLTLASYVFHPTGGSLLGSSRIFRGLPSSDGWTHGYRIWMPARSSASVRLPDQPRVSNGSGYVGQACLDWWWTTFCEFWTQAALSRRWFAYLGAIPNDGAAPVN